MSYTRFLARQGAWLSAACSLLFAASAGQANATTLSVNLSAPTEYTELVDGSNWITAGFSTDNSSYVLSSVTALMQQDAAGTLNLDLYANGKNQPTSLLGSFTSPGNYPIGTLGNATFGGASLLLAPNTTYWLAMNAPASGTFEWAYATNNAGSGVGFQGTWGVSTDSGASWYTSDLQPMQMRVEADPVSAIPEPGSLSLLLLAAFCFGIPIALRATNARRARPLNLTS